MIFYKFCLSFIVVFWIINILLHFPTREVYQNIQMLNETFAPNETRLTKNSYLIMLSHLNEKQKYLR